MTLKRLALYSCLLFSLLPTFGQQPVSTAPVTKDPQAVAALEQAISTMAVSIPTDSTASGSIVIVAGTQTTAGTVRILTKGSNESSFQIVSSGSTDTLTYSNNQAAESNSNAVSVLPLQQTQTTQSVEFPQPVLSTILNDPDTCLQFVGTESLNGQSTNHIQSINTYASQASLQLLASGSIRDIWLDATTALPARISFTRRSAGGASAGVAVDVYFSNYQKFQGVLYPMTIQESLNGTPWETITIQTVSFNTGLTDLSFPIPSQGATP